MLRKTIAAALLLLVSCGAIAEPELPASYAGQDIEHWFQVVSGLSGGGLAALDGQRFTFAVDLENSPGFSLDYDAKAGKATLLYRMAFNNIAEGWSWDQLADPDSTDYYRFKFLPLKSTFEEKTPPAMVELIPGTKREVKNLWRYDYFVAFENLYDFYPRQVNDDAGFSAEIKLESGVLAGKGRLGMLAVCRLKPLYYSESNTFWKADLADPVDYTLRKRYLVVELQEIWYFDTVSGKVLAKVERRSR